MIGKVNVSKSEVVEDNKGSTGRVKAQVIYTNKDIDDYLAKLALLNMSPKANFTYHAYGKPRGEWTMDNIKRILTWCVQYNQPLAVWENFESGIQLFVVKDPDTGHENVGWDLYEYMQGHYRSYGCAHWTEWEEYGIQLNPLSGVQKSEREGYGFILEALDTNLVLIS